METWATVCPLFALVQQEVAGQRGAQEEVHALQKGVAGALLSHRLSNTDLGSPEGLPSPNIHRDVRSLSVVWSLTLFNNRFLFPL